MVKTETGAIPAQPDRRVQDRFHARASRSVDVSTAIEHARHGGDRYLRSLATSASFTPPQN